MPIKEVILRLCFLVLFFFCSDMMILKCVFVLQCGWMKIPANMCTHSAPTTLCLLAVYLRFDLFLGGTFVAAVFMQHVLPSPETKCSLTCIWPPSFLSLL